MACHTFFHSTQQALCFMHSLLLEAYAETISKRQVVFIMDNGMEGMLDTYLFETNSLLDQLDEMLVKDEKIGDFSSDRKSVV